MFWRSLSDKYRCFKFGMFASISAGISLKPFLLRFKYSRDEKAGKQLETFQQSPVNRGFPETFKGLRIFTSLIETFEILFSAKSKCFKLFSDLNASKSTLTKLSFLKIIVSNFGIFLKTVPSNFVMFLPHISSHFNSNKCWRRSENVFVASFFLSSRITSFCKKRDVLSNAVGRICVTLQFSSTICRYFDDPRATRVGMKTLLIFNIFITPSRGRNFRLAIKDGNVIFSQKIASWFLSQWHVLLFFPKISLYSGQIEKLVSLDANARQYWIW